MQHVENKTNQFVEELIDKILINRPMLENQTLLFFSITSLIFHKTFKYNMLKIKQGTLVKNFLAFEF